MKVDYDGGAGNFEPIGEARHKPTATVCSARRCRLRPIAATFELCFRPRLTLYDGTQIHTAS